ncbi:MAG: hypothetical protein ACM3JB_14305 [Acidobacteriaceae bacterium]
MAQNRWPEIVEFVGPMKNRSADVDYVYGIALSRLDRWQEARIAFLAGREQNRNDTRFPLELAGVAFKQKNRPEAKKWLTEALRLSPSDHYANDFLATLYFLDGNLEAALKYWNRAGKPFLENVRTEPELRTDPVLVDRSLAFSQASILTRDQLLISQARLRGLEVFPRFNVQLQARDDGKFDAVVHAQESNGFGDSKWAALLSTFRGAFFETITPEYYNLHGSATNLRALIRWDKNKRRFTVGMDAPLGRDPRWHWKIAADLRNENWSLANFSTLAAPSLGDLNLRREGVSAEIASYRAARWSWSTGGEFSHRDFRNVSTNNALPSNLFLDANELKHFARINYDLLRIPEHRFTVTATGSSEEGRVWNADGSAFAKLQMSSAQHWLPKATSEDFEMQSRISYGHTFGRVPFDELFILGIERDNDLLLRAHVGTSDGKKGSAPLGRNYFLSNWEIDKQLYDRGLFRITLGPFLDTGKITDPDTALGSKKWLFDTGAQLKLRVLGVGFAFTYGKDLRSGNNAFYAYLAR